MNGETSAIHLLARTGPWLAPLPSAWFVGRSIYLHLLLGWSNGRVIVPTWLHVAVALVAGLTVEILAIVSIYNALALFRWNDQGRVEKNNWEHAPFKLRMICTALYLVTAGILLGVLEAWPEASRYAPLLFPPMGIVGAVNLGVLAQHLDRLHRYGLDWSLARAQPTQKAQATASQAQAARKSALPMATIADWRRIYANLDGDRAQMDADGVIAALAERNFAPPARRTAQAWAREARGE